MKNLTSRDLDTLMQLAAAYGYELTPEQLQRAADGQGMPVSHEEQMALCEAAAC